MADLQLTFASQDYDHTRALFDGRVQIPGVKLQLLDLFPPDNFRRMVSTQEFHTGELALTVFFSFTDRGDNPFVAIPVFPARTFRHSAIYVRNDGSVRAPRDLIGKNIGEFNFYGTDAALWAKGMLSDEYGVRPDAYRHFIGGIGKPYEPPSWLPMRPPARVKVEHIGNRTLDDLLEQGEIDAILSPHAPAGLSKRPATARRLFEDYEQVERAWFAKTRIFPIMHTFVIRRDVYEQNRWLARALFDALKQAKKFAMDRFRPPARGSVMPWLAPHAQSVIELMGEDWWPYGIAANRHTLETFARYHHQQGLTRRELRVDELFAPETLDD